MQGCCHNARMIVLGTATFDPAAQLLRDSAGGRVALRAQTLKVLEVLLAANGHVVTKEALADQVWGKVAVTEASLTQCIREIRLAIGDVEHCLLQTEHRRGFRLVMSAHNGPNPERIGTPAHAPIAPDLSTPAIAIMPFTSMDGDERSERLAMTFAGDLISELARHKELRVVGRQSAFSLKGQALGCAEICTRLKARFVVSGQVQFSDSTLKWSLEMVDGQSEEIVWSEHRQINFSDFNSEMAALLWRMAGSIHGSFKNFSLRHSVAQSPESCNAYDLVSRASANMVTNSVEGTRESQRLAAQAVELYPQFSRAWRVLAHSHVIDIVFRHTGRWTDARVDEALAEVRRAIELDPTQALAYGVLSGLLMGKGQVQEAERASLQSIELAPSDPVALTMRAVGLFARGEFAQSKMVVESILAVMPTPENYVLGQYGRSLFATGHIAQAVDVLQQTLAFGPGHNLARQTLVVAMEESGHHLEAAEHFRILLTHSHGFDESFFGVRWSATPELTERYVKALRAHGMKPAGKPEPPRLVSVA